MKKMYPAVVNSPKTELPEAITSTQTDITVSNASVLLAGEGIATIGNGDTAETITYTSVDGNVLKGCIRGYQGVAQSWTVGTRVARNFAAADWDAARDNITELATRLDTPDRASITLQPGVRVVQASQDTAFKLAGLQGRTVLNYQSQVGIYGVLNPYVTRLGENLLPPFYEWTKTDHVSAIKDPYRIEGTLVTGGMGTDAYAAYVLNIIPNQDYTLTNPIESTGFMRISVYNSAGTRIQGIFVKPGETRTIRTSATATMLGVNVSGVTAYTDEFDVGTWTWTVGTNKSFVNPILNIGNTAKSFKPRDESMLALQTELHANPDTGANPDSVFERDGQYLKLAKWRKVSYGSTESWTLGSNKTGYKQVVLAAVNRIGFLPEKSILTKYNGNSLPVNGQAASADTYAIDTNGQVYITVSSTDSGWGDSYAPTADEIKAYFLGWVMTTQESWSTAPIPYNGTGTKGWVRRWVNASQGNPSTAGSIGTWVDMSATPTVPTTMSAGFTPYQLLYQLATPVVEPITSEGQLTFIDGDNQVEVGTGIVLRERANAQVSQYGTYINSAFTGFEQTKLKYRTSKILTLFKDGKLDPSWVRNTLDAYGIERAVLSAYDPNAAYSVTYLMLDKYPTADITGTYAENEKALLLDAVKMLQENTTRISVLESKKAEKDAPAWIAPTLLNNWINYGGTEDGAGYRRNSDGYVHIRGLVKLGVAGAMVFKLPVGYRPKSTLRFPVSGAAKFGEMTIGVDGGIYFNSGIDGTYVSMLIPPFQAEQ